jgi:hypothetical protein
LSAKRACCEARAEFDKELVNLGIVDSTGIENPAISVKNTGTEALKVSMVGSTCGCVSAVEFDETIAPGGTGTIQLKVDTTKLGSGSHRQTIGFVTNDPKRPRVFVDVVWQKTGAPVVISPNDIKIELSKQEIRSYSKRSNRIFVLDTWDKRLEIPTIQASDNLIFGLHDIIYRCSRGSERHVFRINTFLLLDDAEIQEPGTLDAWVKFSTNHPDFQKVTIPIKYHISSGISIEPRTVIFDYSDTLDANNVKTIRVKTSGSENILELTEATSQDAWLSVKQSRLDAQTIDLKVSLKDMQVGGDKDIEKGFEMLRSAIIIEILKPHRIKKTVDVIVIRRRNRLR